MRIWCTITTDCPKKIIFTYSFFYKLTGTQKIINAIKCLYLPQSVPYYLVENNGHSASYLKLDISLFLA